MTSRRSFRAHRSGGIILVRVAPTSHTSAAVSGHNNYKTKHIDADTTNSSAVCNKHQVAKMMEIVGTSTGRGVQTERTFIRKQKRPINKSLVAILKDTVTATDQTTVIFTATFPCTMVGLRWNLAMYQNTGTGTAVVNWAIVIVREGFTIPTLTVSDAGTFYSPESDCLVFGVATIYNNTQTKDFNGDTKTMRKMQGGDRLVFIARGIASETHSVRGIIQFFCKT